MACVVEFFLADVAPVSRWDGVFAAVVMSAAYPRLAPYLLLILSTLQDSPGVSGVGWYAGFVTVGFLVIINGWKSFLLKVRGKLIEKLFIVSLLVVIYSICASVAQQFLGGHPQADSRSPVLVGGLMLFMIIVGVVAASKLSDEDSTVVVKALYLIILHSIFVSVFQIVDVTAFHSLAGIVEINKSSQLSVATALGFPRIAGTYLTPNGWAYCNVLMLLLVMRIKSGCSHISGKNIITFFLVALFFAIISFSKAMLIFVVLSTVLIYLQSSKRKTLALGFLSLLVSLVFLEIDFTVLESAFRLGAASSNSYRYEMWSAIIEAFDWQDWVYGVGLGYWPIFFKNSLNMPESDPHSALLSVPGTFGILGVLLYMFLFFVLVRLYLVGKGFNKGLALVLAILFFVKDMVSYPYFLGNTPITALIWLLLFLAGTNSKKPCR